MNQSNHLYRCCGWLDILRSATESETSVGEALSHDRLATNILSTICLRILSHFTVIYILQLHLFIYF